MKTSCSFALSASIALAFFSVTARAQTWKNTPLPAGGNWSNSAKWSTGAVPNSSNTTALTFNSGLLPYIATDDLGGTFKLNSLTFNPGSLTGIISISASNGSVLKFSGTDPSITDSATSLLRATPIINVPIVLGADTTINGGGLGIVLSGGVSGGGGLTVNGVLTLGGSIQATYKGTTTINGLVTEISSDMLSGKSAVDITAGGTLAVFQDQSIGGLSGTGVVRAKASLTTPLNTLSVGNGNATSTFAGTLQDFDFYNVLALDKVGNGTLTLTGDNSYSGGTDLEGGTIVVGSDTALGTGLITVSGAHTTISTTGAGGTTITLANDVFLAPDLTYNIDASDPALNVSGDLSSDPGEGIIKKGTGTLILSGDNSYSGDTTLQKGTLAAGSATAFGTGNLIVDGGGTTLTTYGAGPITVTNNVILNHTVSVLAGGADVPDLTLSGDVTGTGGLTTTGTGNVTLSGDNDYSGNTTVASGALIAGSTTGLSADSNFKVDATLDLAGFNSVIGSLAGSGQVINSGSPATLTTNGDGHDSTFSGTIQDAIQLIKTGADTLTLSGANTYTGGTVINLGTLKVTGSISHGSADTVVGQVKNDDGFLTIKGSSAFVTDDNGVIGQDKKSAGTVEVNAGTWTNNGQLLVGDSGTGNLTVENGGLVYSNGLALVGDNQDATGTVTVKNDDSVWTNYGDLTVGEKGNGTLNIQNGGTVNNDDATIADRNDSIGLVTVEGDGSTWNNYGDLTVGEQGDATLDIQNKGVVNDSDATIADKSGSTSSVTVEGNGSVWNNYGDLTVGEQGDATLDIQNKGVVNNNDATIADKSGSTSSVTVEGNGSVWNNYGDLTVGEQGNATLDIQNKGVVNNNDATIADKSGSTSSVTVEGNGSVWNNYGDLTVGEKGDATLDIQKKGVVNDSDATIGADGSGSGSVTVTGKDSTWNNYGDLTIGDSGLGSLTIAANGTVNDNNGVIGNANRDNSVEVDNGTWTNDDSIDIGNEGKGSLTIEEGGQVTAAANSTIGNASGARGVVDVTGPGSLLSIGSDLYVGGAGTGQLVVENQGVVQADNLVIGEQSGSTGTVKIGNDDQAGTLAVADVQFGAGNGSLLFDQTGQTTIGATIEDLASGDSGTVTQEGGGTTILTGDNSYTGTTLVTRGRLKVGSDTALGDSDVDVSGGRLSIKGGSGVTDLNVTGDYTQTGGTLRLALLSPTMNEELLVGGNVSLGSTTGTSTLRLGLDGSPLTIANGTLFTLVQSTGLVSGQFGALTFNSNITLPTGIELLTYTPHDVLLGFWSYLGAVSGLTPNQQSVAVYIDQFSPTVTTGNFRTLVENIYPLSTNPSSLGSALDQISPQSLQIWRHISFDNATFASQQLNNHLANLRDGLTGFDGSQLTYSDSTLDPSLAQIQSRLLAWDPNATPGLVSDAVDPVLAGVDMKACSEPCASDRVDQWSTFIAGDVVIADLSHDQDLAHQSYTTGSVTLGADYRLDRHWIVGALFGYGHTDATLDHIGSQTTVDSYSPGVYASYVDGGWYGNGLFSYGYNSYTEDRTIAIGALNGTNTGAPDGSQYVGNLTGGYEFKEGAWKIGPTASTQYVNLEINSFTEQGPAALNVQNQSDESFRTQLGFEARYAGHVQGWFGSFNLNPHISATWQHEFLDDSRGITSQFNQIGAGSFTVQTTPTERDSAVIDAGLDAEIEKELTLYIDYQTEAGQQNYFANSIQGGIKIGF